MFPTGKLDLKLLESLIKRYAGAEDPKVVVGADIGVDAAVIDLDHEEYLIAKTDPITFVTDRIGQYAVTINANDIACMGGRPRWFLVTILLPEGQTDESMVENIFRSLSEDCKRLGIAICGGHTEVTYGLDRPIVVGQMLGTVKKDRLLSPKQIAPGDKLILTKGIAVEGTAIIAQEKERDLLEVFGREFIQRCKAFIDNPGISVLKEAELLWDVPGLKALHDPTEGGVATAINEMAKGAGLGCEVWGENIILFNETKRLCEYLGLDPLGLIASGALLAALKAEDTDEALEVLRKKGFKAECIGVFTEKEEVVLIDNGIKRPLKVYSSDEITKIF
ncbi:MAG: hydrogenase expression/formation protein [Nitrospirae bacterium]|nr:hydrogenase expression/formation protein [Nitrospirota bacterium]